MDVFAGQSNALGIHEAKACVIPDEVSSLVAEPLAFVYGFDLITNDFFALDGVGRYPSDTTENACVNGDYVSVSGSSLKTSSRFQTRWKTFIATSVPASALST